MNRPRGNDRPTTLFFACCFLTCGLLVAAGCESSSRGDPWTPEARGPYEPLEETPVPRVQGSGATYYVSSSFGDDGNDGTSESAPIATIGRVNELDLNPGDIVAFRCGDSWRGEILRIEWSGTEDNYITYTSFPEGCQDRPAILGSHPITGWSLHQGSIYVADLSAGGNSGLFPLGINQLFRRGERLLLGRWPNLDDPDGGYSTIDGHPEGSVIADNELPDLDWTGAVAHVKAMRWYITNREVVGSSTGTLQLGMDPDCWDGCEGWGYFLNNHLAALDQDGEWFYDEGVGLVYLYSTEGAPQDVEGSAVIDSGSGIEVEEDYVGGIIIGHHLQQEAAYVAVENLEISRWFRHGITFPVNLELDENHHLLIRHNLIRDIDGNGINLATWVWNAGSDSGWRGGRNLEVSYNIIERANHFGVTGYFSDTMMVGNELVEIGLLDTVGKSGIGCGYDEGEGQCTEPGAGIRVTIDQPSWNGHHNLIRENRLEQIGHNGIDFFGSDTTIEYNVIIEACTTKGDCGAVRTFGRENIYETNLKRVVIADNLIIDTLGTTFGAHPDFRSLFGFGLYIDNYSCDVHCLGNIVTGSTATGILYQNSCGTIEQNLLFDNARAVGGQVGIHADSEVYSFTGNILASIEDEASTLGMDSPGQLGTTEENSYLHTGLERHIWSYDGSYTLAEWQSSFGRDINGNEIIASAVADALLLYNDTDEERTLQVPGGYRFLDGTEAGDSVTLEPFGSVLLLPEELFSGP